MNDKLKKLYDDRLAIHMQQRKLLDSGRADSEEYLNLERSYIDIDAKISCEEREEEFKRSQNPVILPTPMSQRQEAYNPDLDPTRNMVVYGPGEFKKKFQVPAVAPQVQRDFNIYLSRGLAFLPDSAKQRMAGIDRVETRRTLQTSVDTVGGFLQVPERFGGEVIQDLHDLVFIRDLARNVLEPYAMSVSWPVLDDTVDDSNWTAELKTGSEDSSMDFNKMTLTPHPSAKRVKASETLIRKTGGLAENIIRSELVYKFGITEEKAFLTGDGGGKPIGVFTAASSGGLGITTSRDVSTGNTTTEIKADNLIDVVGSLKAQYRKKACWIFSRAAVTQIRKLKTGAGDYLWNPSIVAGQQNTLLGYPVYESEYCPSTFTTGQYVGIFGDFNYYLIVTALDMRIAVLTELYAETGEIGYIGRMEVDGAPIRENAFARVKLA